MGRNDSVIWGRSTIRATIQQRDWKASFKGVVVFSEGEANWDSDLQLILDKDRKLAENSFFLWKQRFDLAFFRITQGIAVKSDHPSRLVVQWLRGSPVRVDV